jgi:hypothetical protein
MCFLFNKRKENIDFQRFNRWDKVDVVIEIEKRTFTCIKYE